MNMHRRRRMWICLPATDDQAKVEQAQDEHTMRLLAIEALRRVPENLWTCMRQLQPHPPHPCRKSVGEPCRPSAIASLARVLHTEELQPQRFCTTPATPTTTCEHVELGGEIALSRLFDGVRPCSCVQYLASIRSRLRRHCQDHTFVADLSMMKRGHGLHRT
jgi:hypothetical protein